METFCMSPDFQSQSKIGIRVVAKYALSENLILQYILCSIGVDRPSFKTAGFQTEKTFV
jgi:hypothetical protein